jgi:hypothetical protein
MLSIYIYTFFNTGVILLFVNANITESGLPLPFFRDGKYPDFNGYWYKDVGNNMVSTMLVIMIFPLIEFFMWWCINKIYILFDRGCRCTKPKSD